MTPTTPTEDIRAARHRLAAQFENDLDRIVEDLRRKQRDSGREYVTIAGNRVVQAEKMNESVHPTGTRDRNSV